jgi:hypothetical protein
VILWRKEKAVKVVKVAEKAAEFEIEPTDLFSRLGH